MFKRFAVVGAFAIAGLVLPGSALTAHAQGTASSKSAKSAKASKSAGAGSDATFVKKAAEGGVAEVQLGQLAAQKASSDEVKKFGQRMVDDHTKANQQLQQVAQQKGIEVPNELSAKDKATKDRLEKLSGEAFDRAYMDDMVKDHTKDVAEFRTEAKSGSDPDVKSFASATLPTLESHLSDAKKVDSTVKGAAAKSSSTAKKSGQKHGSGQSER